jgi:TPP-dependent trihydroxycyclohexane-1,2-dione (THcHDO) dehydratase
MRRALLWNERDVLQREHVLRRHLQTWLSLLTGRSGYTADAYTIRMHQEREYPGRVIATELLSPDFVALARAYGAHAELVTRTEEFMPAFERAVASGTAALIELRTDPQQITTRSTLASLQAAAKHGHRSQPDRVATGAVHQQRMTMTLRLAHRAS